MGRHRIAEDEKKVALKLSITKKYVDEMKNKNVNISELVENFFKDYLKK